MATPHAIHEEFPNDAEKIHELKVSNAHFAKLLDEYDQINDQVYSAETRNPPVSDEAEKELRQKRSYLKDEIASFLAKA